MIPSHVRLSTLPFTLYLLLKLLQSVQFLYMVAAVSQRHLALVSNWGGGQNILPSPLHCLFRRFIRCSQVIRYTLILRATLLSFVLMHKTHVIRLRFLRTIALGCAVRRIYSGPCGIYHTKINAAAFRGTGDFLPTKHTVNALRAAASLILLAADAAFLHRCRHKMDQAASSAFAPKTV